MRQLVEYDDICAAMDVEAVRRAVNGFSNVGSYARPEACGAFATFKMDGDVNCFAFSPDGAMLAVGSDDRTVKLWSTETGAMLRSLEGVASTVTFSLDGSTLTAGSMDGTVVVGSTETGVILRSFEGFKRRDFATSENAVALSPGGSLAAIASIDKVQLWSAETGAMLWSHDENDIVVCVAFSPDGAMLATGATGPTVKLWSTETGAMLRSLDRHQGGSANSGDVSRNFLKSATGKLTCVAFSEDGAMLAAGSLDGTVKLWSTETGGMLRSIEGHERDVDCVAFSPDGAMLATGSDDRTVKLWSTETGARLRSLEGLERSVSSVAFSPDGSILASRSGDIVKLWSTVSVQMLRSLEGQDCDVDCLAFSPDGSMLATGSHDRTVKLWSTETGAMLRRLKGCRDTVLTVAFSPDGAMLAAGSDDGTVKLWSTETGGMLHSLKKFERRPTDLSFSPDGSMLATGSFDQTVKLWSTETGAMLWGVEGNGGDVVCMAFTPDGETLATEMSDGTVSLRTTDTGLLLQTILKKDRHLVSDEATALLIQRLRLLGSRSTVVSPDGLVVATIPDERCEVVELWVAQDGELPKLDSGSSVFDVLRTMESCRGSSGTFGAKARERVAAHFERALRTNQGLLVEPCAPAYASLRGGRDTGTRQLTTAIHRSAASLLSVVSRRYPALLPLLLDIVASVMLGDEHGGQGGGIALLCPLLSLAMATHHRPAISTAVRILGCVSRRGRRGAETTGNLILHVGPRNAWFMKEVLYLLENYPSQAEELLQQLGLEPVPNSVLTDGAEQGALVDGTMVVKSSPAVVPGPKWRTMLKLISEQQTLGSGATQLSPVVARVVGIPGVIGVNCAFLRTVVECNRPSLFATDIVRAVVQFKWEAYGRARVLRKLCLYLILLALWLADVVCAAGARAPCGREWDDNEEEELERSHADDFRLASLVLEVLMLPLVGYFLQREWQQAHSGQRTTSNHRFTGRDKPANHWPTSPAKVWGTMSQDRGSIVPWELPQQAHGGSNGPNDDSAPSSPSQTTQPNGAASGAADPVQDNRKVARRHTTRLTMAQYFRDQWNVLQLLSYLLLLVTVVLNVTESCGAEVSAAASVLLFLHLLHYARAFSLTGPMVRMLEQIVVDISGFMVIILIALLGFSAAFYAVLSQYGTEGYGRVDVTLFNVFAMMMGRLEAEDLSRNFGVSATLAVLVTLSATVIMLNLLIAIMGDSYDKVQEQAVEEGQRERAIILMEEEALMSEAEREAHKQDWFSEGWLHVLRPQDDDTRACNGDEVMTAGMEWRGRIKKLQSNIKTEVGGVKSEVLAQVEGVKNELKAQVEGVNSQVEGVNARVEDVKAQVMQLQESMEAILTLLKPTRTSSQQPSSVVIT